MWGLSIGSTCPASFLLFHILYLYAIPNNPLRFVDFPFLWALHATNIILLWYMITLAWFGIFPCAISLMLTPILSASTISFPTNPIFPYSTSNATMGVSLTTLACTISLPLAVSPFTSLVLNITTKWKGKVRTKDYQRYHSHSPVPCLYLIGLNP